MNQRVRDFAAVPAVFASAARLGQVFLNLIVNAAQAIPPLIRAAPARASPLPTHVPLNLRYCVLLI